MDIDLVVFYEDIQDPEYKKLRKAYIENNWNMDIDVHENRVFRTQDTLKYFFRSIEKNLKFIRNIFVITNSQIPKWLNYSKANIKILSYKSFIPSQLLPTFNYAVIEKFLPNIPELSDHFLYASENIFFIKNIDKNFFFNKNGYPYIHCAHFFHNNKNLKKKININIRNASSFAKRIFHERPRFLIHSNIEAFYKYDVLKAIELIEKKYRNSFNTKFISESDISRYFWTYYSYYSKHATFKHPQLFRLTFLVKLFAKPIYFLMRDILAINMSTSFRFITKNIKMISFERNSKSTPQDELKAIRLLDKYFPNKSSFEI